MTGVELQELAVKVLVDMMQDTGQGATARVAAARAVLDVAQRTDETVTEQLRRLDEALADLRAGLQEEEGV